MPDYHAMRIAQIRYPDVANGEGIRVSLWLQGCERHCPGCFNPETWDPAGGREMTEEDYDQLGRYLEFPYVRGLSILGGEPMLQANELGRLLYDVNCLFPEKDIWLWTGYKFEEVKEHWLFDFVDVVVDGEFIEAEKDLGLEFRGSQNQRIIRLKPERLESVEI